MRQGFFWALGGFTVGIVPFLLWLAARGALAACWEAYIVFNVHYTDQYLALVKKLVPMENRPPESMMGRYPVFLHFAKKGAWQAFVLCLLAMSGRRRWCDGAAWASLGMLLLSLVLICMSAMPFGHYGMAMLPTLVYPMAVFCGAMERVRVCSMPVCHFVLAFGGMVFASCVLFSGVRGYIARCQQPLKDPASIHMAEAALYIRSHTSSEDRILVCGIQTAVYPLSGRLSSSRYSYQFPIVFIESVRQEEFLDDINRSLPKMIVARKDMPEYEPEKLREFMQAHNYVAVTDYEGTDDLVIYALPEPPNR